METPSREPSIGGPTPKPLMRVTENAKQEEPTLNGCAIRVWN